MKRLILACWLCLCCACAWAERPNAALRLQVNAFVDAWHDDAAHARMAYFDKIAQDGVYIGTDKSELWQREQFKEWARKHFERNAAWTFKTLRRNVYASADKYIVWFDELLDTQMGVCQASGVIHRTPTGFEIVHYQLSIAVPNGVAAEVSKTIKAFEATAGTR